MKNKKTIFLICGAVGLVLVIILSIVSSSRVKITPNEQPYKTTEGTGTDVNTWNGITPGASKLQQNNAALGPELARTEYKQALIKHIYGYISGPLQVTVITDVNNTVRYMQMPDFQTTKGSMDAYISKNKLGNPDFETYVKGASHFEKVYVFLSKGVALMGNSDIRDIHQIRFFEPTTKEKFMADFGDDLSFNLADTSSY